MPARPRPAPAFLAALAALFSLLATAHAVACPEVVRLLRLPVNARQSILAGQTASDSALLSFSAVISDRTGTCSATVLNSRYLLTAAHCDYAPDAAVRVAVRRNVGETAARVARFVKHPLYTGGSILHDIAVVELDVPLPAGERVLLHAGAPPPPGAFVRAAGYGVDRPDFKQMPVAKAGMGVFRRVDLPVVETGECKKRLVRNNIQLPPAFTKFNYVCAGFISPGHCGGDTCVGDSGGPIVIRRKKDGKYVQVGLTSAGSGCGGASNLPGIYTNVATHVEWVRKAAPGGILTSDAFAEEEADAPSAPPKETTTTPAGGDKGGKNKPPAPPASDPPGDGKPVADPAGEAPSTKPPSGPSNDSPPPPSEPSNADASPGGSPRRRRRPKDGSAADGSAGTDSPATGTNGGTPIDGADADAAAGSRGPRGLSRGGTVALITVFSILGVAVLAILAFFGLRAARADGASPGAASGSADPSSVSPPPTAPAAAAAASAAPSAPPAERAPVLLVPASASTGGASAPPPPPPPPPPLPPPTVPDPALPAPPPVLPAPPPVLPGPSNV